MSKKIVYKCGKCDSVISDSASFCPECGIKLKPVADKSGFYKARVNLEKQIISFVNEADIKKAISMLNKNRVKYWKRQGQGTSIKFEQPAAFKQAVSLLGVSNDSISNDSISDASAKSKKVRDFRVGRKTIPQFAVQVQKDLERLAFLKGLLEEHEAGSKSALNTKFHKEQKEVTAKALKEHLEVVKMRVREIQQAMK